MTDTIKNRTLDLEKWIKEKDYKGYEWYDGLTSYLRPLTFNNLLLERSLTQVVKRAPFNIRPLLGIRPQESSIGRGFMARGYLAMSKLTGNSDYERRAISCLDWLIANQSPNYEDPSWGFYCDFSTRGGRLKKNEPTIVWTSLIGQAFLDGYEMLCEEKYLDAARGACRWILTIPREETDQGTCMSYISISHNYIHNSNLLGAATLARTAAILDDASMMDVAREAVKYSCVRQLEDGSWWYGEDPKYHWIDNFHTGYNLDSIKCYIQASKDETWRSNMNAGLSYYKSVFFEDDGTPKYYHDSTYPIDIQCASQSIDTLTNFADVDDEALELAKKVAHWTITNMQDKKGYFYFRKNKRTTNKTPMFHWGQATMYKALTHLMLNGSE